MLLGKNICVERADRRNKLRVNVSISIKPISSNMEAIWVSVIQQGISSLLKSSGDQTSSIATISCSYPQFKQMHAKVVQPSISDTGSVRVSTNPLCITIIFGNCNNLFRIFNETLWGNSGTIGNISISANINVSQLNRQQRKLILDNVMCDFL